MASDRQDEDVGADALWPEGGVELLLDELEPTGSHVPAAPHVIVLFGATGDLAKRKLMPGLFHLSRAGMLPDCRIVATSLELLDDGEYHGIARTACDEFARGGVTDDHWGAFQERLGLRARRARGDRPGRDGPPPRGHVRRRADDGSTT